MSRPRCSELLLLLLLPEQPLRLQAAGARRWVAWGGFLATRGPERAQLSALGEPPHPGAGAGPLLPSPSPASFPSPSRWVHPRVRQRPGFWTAGRLSHKLGPEGRGHEAPAPQGRATAPSRNLPSCASGRALHSRPSGELLCLALGPRAPLGASRVLPESFPPALGNPRFLPHQPGHCRFDFARGSADEAAKL